MQFNNPASTKMKTNQLLKSSLTHLLLGLLAAGTLLATALSANASVVNFALGADDYGTLTIGGVILCTYDNISAAGGCNSSFDMQPGVWYDIAIDYKNRFGSDGMSLSWDQPGPASIGYGFSGSFPGLVPKANLRTLNAGGTSYVSGLHGDYYDLTGNLQSTVIGEGPIDAINNVYNNRAVGSWNGYGYFSLFEERLSGQIQLTTPPTPASQLRNISTRAFVQTGDNVIIGGFIVTGTGPKTVIVRAIGPELTPFGIIDPLADPTLELHDSTGALIASNDNWQTTIIGGIITSDQVSAIRNSGHAPGEPSESAIIATLPPGNYTAIVRGVNNTIGVALAEVYDLSPVVPIPTSILGNISTRGLVQTGDNVMIGGFIIEGTGPKKVIVRAIGPELIPPPYNIPNALADPTLELHDGTGALIASNDNWQTTIIGGIITKDQARDIQNSGHAPSQPSESAIIATLPPGNYTAIVRGKNIIIGVALVEVYDLQ
jgi:hypothetical protein